MRRFSTGKRPSARLVTGIILTAVSVVGVVGLVRVSGHAQPVLTARHLLVEGQQVRADDLLVRDIGSTELAGEYLTNPSTAVGQIVVRAVVPGELIPRASLASASHAIDTTIVVELQSPVAQSVHAGDVVDLWAAAKPNSSSLVSKSGLSAHLVVARARLASVSASSGLEASAERVDLVVEKGQVAAVLDAQALDLGMYLVPAAGALG